MKVQLLQDVADVVLHRVLGDEQRLGDVSVVHPLRDEAEDLHLAVGEPRRRHLRLLHRRLADGRELREQLARHRRADARLAGPHRPDRIGDLVDGDLLQQVPRGGRLDPGALGHANVHQDDVRHQLLRLLDDLDAVGRLADELEVRFLVQHHLKTPTEQRVVIAYQDAQAVGFVGSLAHDVSSPSRARVARSLSSPLDWADFTRPAPAISRARRFLWWSRTWRSSLSTTTSSADSTSRASAWARYVFRAVAATASTR